MIPIDFSVGVALFCALILAGLLLAWIFARKGKDKDLTVDPKFIWFCSVCTYTYINTKEEKISVCPRCGSYNTKK